MPPVGVLVPIYLIYRDFGLLDTRAGLVFILCLGNLPIVIWMLFTYFKRFPRISRSGPDGRSDDWTRTGLCADADGHSRPWPRRFSSNFILGVERGVLDVKPLDAGRCAAHGIHRILFKSEGLFWAKLSAASTLAIAPIIVLGWFSQRQLVRGLTFGAVK